MLSIASFVSSGSSNSTYPKPRWSSVEFGASGFLIFLESSLIGIAGTRTYGKDISAISPKGKNAASRFAAVTMGANPPT